jgi:predicted Zn-dependent protease with MMP-like domain
MIVAMRMSAEDFEQVVEEALEHLPQRFSDMLDNIAVVVEEEPTEEDLELLEDEEEDDDDELLGIYRGVPLPERSYGMPLLPDQVAIFRGPILRIARNRREAVREIRDTVVHELGHYFGLSDDEMIF